MGVGGLGGYIGGRLAHSGQGVTFIARGQRLQAIRANGLHVRSPEDEFVVHPAHATDDPREVGPVDVVLFCVKTYDVPDAVARIAPLVGPQTAVLPIQNGVGHIEQLQRAVGQAAVLGGVAMLNAHSTAPNAFERPGGPHRLELGEIDGHSSPRCQAIVQALSEAGIDAHVMPNIQERMWWKFAGICGAGVFSVMRGSKGQIWGEPETHDLLRQAIAEAVAVANARGIPLAATLPDEAVQVFDTFPPPYKPSMLIDLEQGRRLELEALNGTLVRLGDEVSIPTPVNDFIYACLKPYANGRRKGTMDDRR
ncbi:MAG: 2-dehydropantoate 2-reductase [Chloroflexi bacterium]|nr:MAG: 2-dehydropantoate 2-reductase [Chloroflexota bacterium]